MDGCLPNSTNGNVYVSAELQNNICLFFVLLMGFNAFYFISRMQGRVNICICRGEHFAFFMFINEAPGGKQTKAFITQQLNQKQLQPSGVSRNNQNLSSNTHQSSLSLLDQNYNSLCFGQPAGQFYQQQQIQHVTLLKKRRSPNTNRTIHIQTLLKKQKTQW